LQRGISGLVHRAGLRDRKGADRHELVKLFGLAKGNRILVVRQKGMKVPPLESTGHLDDLASEDGLREVGLTYNFVKDRLDLPLAQSVLRADSFSRVAVQEVAENQRVIEANVTTVLHHRRAHLPVPQSSRKGPRRLSTSSRIFLTNGAGGTCVHITM
jgi:hypothetical protein